MYERTVSKVLSSIRESAGLVASLSFLSLLLVEPPSGE